MAERILAQVVSLYGGYDVRVWRSLCNSRVVIGDLYNLYKREQARCLDRAWIWRLGVYLRVSLFMRKVAWACLPIRSILRDRRIDLTPSCPCCECGDEALDHVFFLSSRAGQIW